MTIPAIHELDPLEELKALRQQAGDDPLAQLKTFKRRPEVRGAATDATRALSRERDGASGDFEATAPAVLGTLAAPIRHIPGAEAVAAAVRAGVRGQSYPEARNDIRDAVDEAPGAATVPLMAAGGALSALALPGSMVRQGLVHGALNSALDSDPNRGIGSRAVGAAAGAATEGALGAIGGTANAIRLAPSGTLKEVADEALGGTFVGRAARKWRAIHEAIPATPTALPESPVVGTIAPKVEGLMGNSMDDVLRVMKSPPEAEASSVLNTVKKSTRNRPPTRARMARDAERFGLEPPPPPPQARPRTPDVEDEAYQQALLDQLLGSIKPKKP